MNTQSINRPAGMPAPNMNPVEAGIWQAAAEGRLDVQRCKSCDSHRNPPSEACIFCGSFEWRWDTLPGTGQIATYVWCPDSTRGADFPSPYFNIAVVDLDGAHPGPLRIVTNIIDAWQLDDLAVGQKVELACVKLSDQVGLPCFKRAVAGERA
jgi:uncharacterized OB-fold protein